LVETAEYCYRQLQLPLLLVVVAVVVMGELVNREAAVAAVVQ
jgi:uncharacterized integral membrane protein